MRSLILLFASSLLFPHCKQTTDPPNGDAPIRFTALDASCIEVWLEVKMADGLQPRTVTIRRALEGEPGDTLIYTGAILSSDTLVVDEGLLPNRSYTYTLTRSTGPFTDRLSTTIQTMDTTSHDWVFDPPVLLGDGGGSVLYDVAIINDTLVYATGAIYKRDSLGNWDPTPYGMAIWNGTSWRLVKLFAQYPGATSLSLVRPRGIHAFSSTDVWLADADVFRWDGQSSILELHQLVNTVLSPGQLVDKLWGSQNRDLYGVGANGGIAHYNGSSWRRIESGTNIRVLDIWGTPDGEEVWACGWHASTGGNVVLRKQSPQWQVMPLPPPIAQGELLGSLWMHARSEVLLSGSGDVFRQSILDLNVIRRDPVRLGGYAYRIRGAERNDIALIGDASMMWTWNGFSWRRHGQIANMDDRLYGLAISATLIVAAGTRFGSALNRNGLVWIGRR